MSAILKVSKLTKAYPANKIGEEPYLAVNNLSFQLGKGEVLGLLGPNGAGKTTTIQMLLGLTKLTSGSIHYFDKELHANREYVLSRINFASAYSHVQGKMTVRQNLKIYGMIYGAKNLNQKIEQLAELLEIKPILDTIFWKISSGQQTRVILAKGLINEPQVLLMDEPTASLDPDIVNKILDLIRSLQKEKQLSILYTSHNMEEITRICNRVMFLQKGELVAEDTPLGLTKLIGDSKLIITFDKAYEKASEYLSKKQLSFSAIRNHLLEINLPEEKIPETLFDLKKLGVWITDIDIKKPTMEDVFLSFARKGNT